MKKRIVCFLLVSVMLFVLLPTAAFAIEEDCTIRVSQVTAKPGETVSVDILVENNPGIQGATLTLTWDSALTLTEKPENGEAFSVLNPTFQKKLSSPYNLFWYAQDLDEQDIQDGVIATLKFAVSADAKDGDKLQIGVSVFPGDLVDQKRTPVDCKLISGTVCVSDLLVQAAAIQTAQTVSVSIFSKIAVANANVYLAEYSETGQYLGCALKTVNLKAGENTVTFSNVRSATEHETFVTNSGQQPLCTASAVKKQ